MQKGVPAWDALRISCSTIAKRKNDVSHISSPQNPQRHPETEQQPLNWRAHLRIHPAAELFPLMTEAELRELAEDIKTNGLIDPIVTWAKDDNLLLDGRNRLDALALAGLLGVDDAGRLCDVKSRNRIKLQVYTEGDPWAIALSLNVHRRHLNAEQKRDLIAKVLKAQPATSNRQIAGIVKADDKTVANVRSALESTAEIPQLKKTKGKDGKARPVKAKKKSIPITVPSVPSKAAIDTEPEVKPALVAIPTQAGTTLSPTIQSEWREAIRTLEILTSHTPAQVAAAVTPKDVPLIAEIANYFGKFVTLATTTHGKAPAGGPMPDDLSIRSFL
jgi:hypothetical protein